GYRLFVIGAFRQRERMPFFGSPPARENLRSSLGRDGYAVSSPLILLTIAPPGGSYQLLVIGRLGLAQRFFVICLWLRGVQSDIRPVMTSEEMNSVDSTPMRTFEDLECWKQCRALRIFVAKEIVPALPNAERHRLGDQFSVPDVRPRRTSQRGMADFITWIMRS